MLRAGAGLSLLFALPASLLLGACTPAGVASLTAPEVPCEASEIDVSHLEGGKGGDGPVSWLATCGEQRWFCSRLHQRVLCDDVPAGMDWPPPERADAPAPDAEASTPSEPAPAPTPATAPAAEGER